MKTNMKECIELLSKVHEDNEAYQAIERIIKDYFGIIEHMMKTSLWDVYMYEERIAKNTLEPMEILVYENEKLKKEVNKLRKQLDLCEKYKITQG